MPFGPTLGVGLGVQTMTFGPTPTQVISEKLLFKVPPLVMCVSHGVQPGSPAYSYCATGMVCIRAMADVRVRVRATVVLTLTPTPTPTPTLTQPPTAASGGPRVSKLFWA